jgi:hypothetical protein
MNNARYVEGRGGKKNDIIEGIKYGEFQIFEDWRVN